MRILVTGGTGKIGAATVAALLDAAWWDLPHATVSGLVPLLCSDRTDDLLAALAVAREP